MMQVHELKRYGLKVTISSLEIGRRLAEIALGYEARTLSLIEFTSFWLDMVEISRQGDTAELNFLNGAKCPRYAAGIANSFADRQEITGTIR
jgi:hypothetical protein